MRTGWLGRARGFLRAVVDRGIERYDRGDGFDARYGTETTSIVHVAERADHDEWQLRTAHQYCPVHVRALTRVLDSVAGRTRGSTFVDLGSGKGRAALLATSYPFAQIVGVELAADLHRAAVSNLERARPRLRDPDRVRFVQGDAREMEWPSTPLVVFAFCPFSVEVMGAVVDRLDGSLARAPRRCTFLYLGSEGPDAAVARSRFLRETQRGQTRGVRRLFTDSGRHVIYEFDPVLPPIASA